MNKLTPFFALALTLGLTFSACSKSALDTPPVVEIPETLPPIQKPVSVSVNSNIGGYMEALPARYDSSTKKYPLLIFIHGVGELGNGTTDLQRVAGLGTPGYIKQQKFPASFTVNGSTFSFIVISPQFKSWPSSADVDALITHVQSKYRVDPERIYVSGLSMGGGVTWDFAAAFNNKVAAIVPICGAAGPTDAKASKIAAGKIAVWAFHNEDDGTVTVNNSKGFVNKINALSPTIPARITLWPTGGHDAWTKATNPEYRENGKNMYEWMLQYKRAAGQ